MFAKFLKLYLLFIPILLNAQSLERQLNQTNNLKANESLVKSEVKKFVYKNSLIYSCEPDYSTGASTAFTDRDLFYFYTPPDSIPENYPLTLKNKSVIIHKFGMIYDTANPEQRKNYSKIRDEKWVQYNNGTRNGKNIINPLLDPELEQLLINIFNSNQSATLNDISIQLPNSEEDKKNATFNFYIFNTNGNYLNWKINGNEYELNKLNSTLFSKISNLPVQTRKCRLISKNKDFDIQIKNSQIENQNDSKYMVLYDQLKKEFLGKKEYKIRLISVDSESAAISILMRIKSGERFEDLAIKYSTDSDTSNKGGEINDWLFFSPLSIPVPLVNHKYKNLLPEIQKLNKGEISSLPTKFGNRFVIIRVDNIRDAALPGYVELKPLLVKYVQ